MWRCRSRDPLPGLWVVVLFVHDMRGLPIGHGKRSLFHTSCICGDAFHLHLYAPQPYVCPGLRPLNSSSRIHRTCASCRPTNTKALSQNRVSVFYNHSTQLSHLQKVDLFQTPSVFRSVPEFSESTSNRSSRDFNTYQTVTEQLFTL